MLLCQLEAEDDILVDDILVDDILVDDILVDDILGSYVQHS